MYSLQSLVSRRAAGKIRTIRTRFPFRRLDHVRRVVGHSFATEAIRESKSGGEEEIRWNSSRVVKPGQKEISLASPTQPELNISLLWLRDHCRCSQCVNKDTKQRSFDTFSVPYGEGTRYAKSDTTLRVEWPDKHISIYPLERLKGSFDEKSSSVTRVRHEYWGSNIKNNPPSVHYDEVMSSDAGVGQWTSKIAKYGFCFVDGCPISPEKTEELLQRIAFIRVTHYGGFYDFTSDLTMKDTAYTSLALPAHTDNTYFTDPSGLQMFHLLSHTSGTGGASLLVDSFHCANLLKKADPRAYEILATYPVQWHASGNDGIIITPAHKFPVLNERRDTLGRELLQVRWNNDDRAAMPAHTYMDITVDEWYDAARLWNSIVKDEKNEYWEQLRPGRPLIFDNWRVMHGRSVFMGKRRMCGGYINRDDYMSRYLNTNFKREDILDDIL